MVRRSCLVPLAPAVGLRPRLGLPGSRGKAAGYHTHLLVAVFFVYWPHALLHWAGLPPTCTLMCILWSHTFLELKLLYDSCLGPEWPRPKKCPQTMHTVLLPCVGMLQARRQKTLHSSVQVVNQSPLLLVPSLWVSAATITNRNFNTVLSACCVPCSPSLRPFPSPGGLLKSAGFAFAIPVSLFTNAHVLGEISFGTRRA